MPHGGLTTTVVDGTSLWASLDTREIHCQPIDASTFGTGTHPNSAREGAEDILVGLGGSASIDGGLGALHAMRPLKRYSSIEINVACDVQTGFIECAGIFGPQRCNGYTD